LTVRASLNWQSGTVIRIEAQTSRTKSLTLALPEWTAHLPGQHYDVRLTAPDGYRTERSYSAASEPERAGELELTVERIDDGEVSTYLDDVVVVGDRIEVRGPIGGYFVWHVSQGGPLLLVGGGSGVVPLMAMLRHRAAQQSTVPTRLLYSCRSADDVIYRAQLGQLTQSGSGLEIAITYTRTAPPGWVGYQRRIDRAMLHDVVKSLGSNIRAYVCGPTLLVEPVSSELVAMAVATERIRTERFGPTGS
jgi:ferredoxin-NADP reductase